MARNEQARATERWGEQCNCKVGRLCEEYELTDLHASLVGRWRGEGHEECSLRDLEAYVNQRLLRAAMTDAGMAPIDGEVENVHELLVGDRATAGTRTEVEYRLARNGVDVPSLKDDFVSHQTIHTHLRECLDVSKSTDTARPDERRDRVADTVFALRNRTEVVTKGSLQRLRDADAMALADFDVLVDVTVTCDSCGRVHDVGTLLDQNGCACQQVPE